MQKYATNKNEKLIIQDVPSSSPFLHPPLKRKPLLLVSVLLLCLRCMIARANGDYEVHRDDLIRAARAPKEGMGRRQRQVGRQPGTASQGERLARSPPVLRSLGATRPHMRVVAEEAHCLLDRHDSRVHRLQSVADSTECQGPHTLKQV